MTGTPAAISRAYPRTVKLDNNRDVTLRLMTVGDEERLLAFARGLPEQDLLFLRTDITDPEAVRRWVQNIVEGRTVTVLAEADGAIAGYGSLHYNTVYWERHLGEIRLLVGQRLRSQGLGRILAAEIFAIARDLGLRKIIAEMTPDQKGAVATFERLGFQAEALLQDFVIDRAGRTHDRIVMAYDVEGLTDRVD